MSDSKFDARFDPGQADTRWQQAWDEAQAFRADDASDRPRSYVLEMFPYPSGRIHIGHVRNYTMGDVLARYKRMTGHEVLHPMGWDAFGMPAENAAIEKGVHPGEWTYANIANMKAQLKRLGFALDWSRELATCDPAYYGHEQALFIDLFNAGLVYRRESTVNWDPVDQTVLANEQVIDGKGWRSGATVEKRKLAQWFLKITDFAQELLDGLGALEDWPEKVRLMQENWIGKSTGLQFAFDLSNGERLEVYTTRPDTIFGATFVAVAPDHPLAQQVASTNCDAAKFIEQCRRGGTTEAELETAEKLGFDTGIGAKHPFTGAYLPVFIANFVLMDYGTGAIMAVPGHDQRDFDFATKYALPIVRVIAANAEAADAPLTEAESGDGVCVHSDFLNGMGVAEAKAEVIRRIEADDRGSGKTVWRLRDWGVSRQRYWGTPIPFIHCSSCGVVPVPKDQLPVVLPDDVDISDPGQSAGAPPDLEACRLPPVRRQGGARDRHARHLRRQLVVFPALRFDARRPAVRSRGGQEMAPGRPVHRRHRARDPAPALRSLLDPRAGPHRQAGGDGAVRQPVHAGHGDARDLFAPRGRARGVLLAGRGNAHCRRGDADRRLAADHRPGHQDVEVEEEHGRPGRDRRPLRCRRGALVHAVGFAAGTRPAVVGSGHRRLLALRPAPVAAVRALRRGCSGHRSSA